MDLITGQKAIPMIVEDCAFEGVKRTAAKVADDVFMVTGAKPDIVNADEARQNTCSQYLICATIGNSVLAMEFAAKGKIELKKLEGKREVYQLALIRDVFEQGDEALLILGSDKRGTIYGMYTFSEYIGVSPLWFWGDVKPMHREQVVIGKDIETISKEPSVKYRGFFINDEWPCFGSWVTSHFGDFNAEAYEYVFDFLLRMKGNYLWPAMWTASFPLDGPGSGNEELADIYGVVMGYSHHEPCLRASEEWDKVRGPESIYGNEWNYYTNEEGLIRYWEDALKRSGKYENVITIGMRGERDTSMLGDDATVEENVNLLKRIITKQHELIRKNVNEDLSRVPRMLALYKEVEAYFYGDGNIRGLKDWKELDGVICMLCEDNFGHMRTLPTEEIRNRKGGFGMYYHFDYHGDPVSYEWVDSTPLSLTWEQMCTAYEYGIRDMWIVNVGDLKFHEVPLTYFMALAYDYEKWGYGNKESYRQYTREWTEKTFPEADRTLQEKIAHAFTEYIDINFMRRPEALHPNVYHPCHYGETDVMLERAYELERLSEEIMEELPKTEKDAYYSMIHFPLTASMNLLKMHLYAGRNEHYARQGRPVANLYGRLTEESFEKDKRLADEFGSFLKGKWDGMQLASHIGFTKWNEDDYRYPVVMKVHPVHKPIMSVSRADESGTATRNYAVNMVIDVPDFLYEGEEKVLIEIANCGVGSLHYTIWEEGEKELPAWLTVTPVEGDVAILETVELSCDRTLLPKETQSVRLIVSDGETKVDILVSGRAVEKEGLPVRTYLPMRDGIVIEAAHFAEKADTEKGSFEVMDGYGKYGMGLKVFPSTAFFTEEEARPFVTYRFLTEEAGEYMVSLIVSPTNSPVNGQKVRLTLENGKGGFAYADVVPEHFLAGSKKDARWTEGVLNQERCAQAMLYFEKGVQELKIGALETGAVLMRVIVRKAGMQERSSYLGGRESAR